jgi:dihydropteroate synthase
MHIKWSPKNMQDNPKYDDIIWEINNFFEEKLKIVHLKWIKNIILDPWFGFWKTIEDNYKILNNISEFKKYWYEILIWLSRKSMIYKALDSIPQKILSESTSLNLYALQKWWDILRVHDVLVNKNIIKLYNLIENNK